MGFSENLEIQSNRIKINSLFSIIKQKYKKCFSYETISALESILTKQKVSIIKRGDDDSFFLNINGLTIDEMGLVYDCDSVFLTIYNFCRGKKKVRKGTHIGWYVQIGSSYFLVNSRYEGNYSYNEIIHINKLKHKKPVVGEFSFVEREFDK